MDFTASPVRDIRNSNYNYVSNTSQQYQEEFWKLKAQKAATTIEQLKAENHMLNKRFIQMSRIEQELREKIIYYEDDWKNRSRRLTTERVSERLSDAHVEDKLTSTHELERLYKEIRIIKNTHEVQMTKLKQQNKKLKKQAEQSYSLAALAKGHEEKLKEASSLNNEVTHLKRKIGMLEENLSRLREEKAKMMSENDQLRKEINEIRLKEKLNQKEEEQKLLDYKRRLEELNDLRVSKKRSEISPIAEEPKLEEQSIPILTQRDPQQTLNLDEDNEQLLKECKDAKEELESVRKQLEIMKKKEAEYENQLAFEKTNLENERFSNQIKLKKLDGELIEARTELSDVLRKLSPLMQKKSAQLRDKENADSKASLSILQIYLRRYKIQTLQL